MKVDIDLMELTKINAWPRTHQVLLDVVALPLSQIQEEFYKAEKDNEYRDIVSLIEEIKFFYEYRKNNRYIPKSPPVKDVIDQLNRLVNRNIRQYNKKYKESLSLKAVKEKHFGKMNDFDYTEKINKANEKLIQELFAFEKARKYGNRIKASCPFHQDKTPSFYIYLETNSFYCFSCNVGGDAISFIKNLNKMDFKEAVSFLNG